MLTKLLSLLAQAKGAAAATVIVAGAATATVAATTPEVQDAVQQVTSAVTGASASPRAKANDDCDRGQPAVVAQRNAADKLLRDAYNDAHKKLEDLRGGKDTDNKTVGEIVKKYDGQLKDALDLALVKTAALTLGRDGQVRKAESSASPKPSGSPTATPTPTPTSTVAAGSPSPKPSCSPKPSGSAAPTAATGSESPKPSGSGKPDDQGRVAVAERTTLDADVKAIVDQTTTLFTEIVAKATVEAKAVPSPDHGKPSDKPDNSNKPDNAGGGKPTGSPGRP